MHVIEWVTKTVNRDGKNLRHLKSQKINLLQSFLYFWAFNLVFICPTLCHQKTTYLLLMKQKLYALDAFFIEKLKLSENDPEMIKTVQMPSLEVNKTVETLNQDMIKNALDTETAGPLVLNGKHNTPVT